MTPKLPATESAEVVASVPEYVAVPSRRTRETFVLPRASPFPSGVDLASPRQGTRNQSRAGITRLPKQMRRSMLQSIRRVLLQLFPLSFVWQSRWTKRCSFLSGALREYGAIR